MTELDRFSDQWAVMLTSYRRDGTPVGTPVNIAVDGDRAFVRSPGNAWKVKRVRRNPRVEIAPCTMRGRVTGPGMTARARQVDGDDAALASRSLRSKHPVVQGVMVPIVHRLTRSGTAYIELRPSTGESSDTP